MMSADGGAAPPARARRAQRLTDRSRSELADIAAVVLGLLLARLALAALTGQWPWLAYNPYNSYNLQARGWLAGRLDLGQDYPWLELAIYQEKYYVSFPPFPSAVLLPFAVLCGEATPDAWIALAFSVLAAVHAVRIARCFTRDSRVVCGSALALLTANGYLFLCLNGWVWFFAQNICFALTLAAIDHALHGRGAASLALWACAVGCRPMMILLLPVLLVLLWRAMPEAARERTAFLRLCALWLILPALIGGSYAALNWARFGHPLEFGHNYLPEFQRAEQGQFSLTYAWEHLLQWLRPLPLTDEGRLDIPVSDGMPVWLTTPLLFSAGAEWVAARRRRERASGAMAWLLPLVTAAYLFIILCHRTLGGWQFGNRYVVDVLPMLYLALLAERPERGRLDGLHLSLAVFGCVMHAVGTAALYNAWI